MYWKKFDSKTPQNVWQENTFEQRYLEMIAHYKLALVLVNWKPGLLTLLNVIRRGADQNVSFDLRFLTYCNVKKGV